MQMYELERMLKNVSELKERVDGIEQQLSELVANADTNHITHNIVVNADEDVDKMIENIKNSLQQSIVKRTS